MKYVCVQRKNSRQFSIKCICAEKEEEEETIVHHHTERDKG